MRRRGEREREYEEFREKGKCRRQEGRGRTRKTRKEEELGEVESVGETERKR